MTASVSPRTPVQLHLTNVAGAGASQLLQSLLPALGRDPIVTDEHIELPDRGKLADYRSRCAGIVPEVYRPRLTKSLSRMLKCTWLASRFDAELLLPVLGVFVRRPAFEAVGFRFDMQMGAGTRRGIGKETELCCRPLKKGALIEYLGWIQVFHALPENQDTDLSKYCRNELRFVGTFRGSRC